jgi:hypothetical protein
MNNISKTQDFYYLLVDELTTGILGGTSSFKSSIAMTLLNSRIRMIPIAVGAAWIDKVWSTLDFNDLNNHYSHQTKQGHILGELHSKIVTAEYIAYRKEIQIRLDFQESLITFCEMSILGISETPFLIDYGDTILHEINNSDPTIDQYTDAIKSYAFASDCSNSTAYQELKLHMENMSLVRMRNLGIYIKYRNKLHATPGTMVLQKNVLEAAKSELFKNASV